MSFCPVQLKQAQFICVGPLKLPLERVLYLPYDILTTRDYLLPNIFLEQIQ
jgi:hypothetical protein